MRVSLSVTVALAVLAAACATAPQAAPPAGRVPFAFRDPGVGLPAAALPRASERRLRAGMEALLASDLPRASEAFQAGLSGAPEKSPFRLGLAYVALASGRLADARPVLDEVLMDREAYAPAVEARADLDAAEGRGREALEGYRALLKLLPQDARARARERETRTLLFDQRRREAEAALRDKDLAGARRAAVSLVELDASSPAGLQYLSRAAEANGKLEDAYLTAQKARALDPADTAWTASVAELAMKTGRYAEAAYLFGELSASDPSFSPRAEAARMEFRIQHLPEVARRAALSPRLTRAQFAALSYWVVPEVRDASLQAAPEVASDALERPERQALVRAIGLGFFAVSRETHTVGADVPLTRTELAGLLRKVAGVVRGRGVPVPGCLGVKEVTPISLVECGILSDGVTKNVTGKEAVAALQAAALASRGGAPR